MKTPAPGARVNSVANKDWAQLNDQEAARAYRDLAADLNSLARNLVLRGMHIQVRMDWQMAAGVPQVVVKVLREMVVE